MPSTDPDNGRVIRRRTGFRTALWTNTQLLSDELFAGASRLGMRPKASGLFRDGAGGAHTPALLVGPPCADAEQARQRERPPLRLGRIGFDQPPEVHHREDRRDVGEAMQGLPATSEQP